MKPFAAILLVILVSHCAFAAETTRHVNVFTLTNGSKVVAASTTTSTVNGKTTYQCTQMDGSKTAFDSTQVANVEQKTLTSGTNTNMGLGLGLNIGTSKSINFFGTQGFVFLPGANYGLGNQVYGSNGVGGINGIDSFGSPVIGYTGNGSNKVQYANSNSNQQFNNSTTFSPVIGMNPNIPYNWNASLAQAGGTYIPNNSGSPGISGFGNSNPYLNAYSAAQAANYYPNPPPPGYAQQAPSNTTVQAQTTVNHQGGTYNRTITFSVVPVHPAAAPAPAVHSSAPAPSMQSSASSFGRK